MATPTPGAVAAPLNLTPLERPAFAALFAAADTSNSGIITGSVAVAFFARSRPALSSAVLGAIWSLADRANNGFLGKAEWAVAMRLMAHAQRGASAEALEGLLSQPGPPPAFEGVQLPGQQTPSTPSRHLTGNAQQAITISPADRARYTRIFASSGPTNGLLDGEKAKSIFVRSQLPFETLGAIWTLADTRVRGALDLTDFIIGMHFLQATMNGTLSSLPATLPAGLYEQASGGAPAPVSPLTAQNTGGSAGGLQRQMTGNALQRQMTGGAMSPTAMSPQQGSILRGPAASSFLSPQRTGGVAGAGAEWLVTPTDKVKADRFFDGLDTERKGTLEGQAAVPFFMQSGLPEATLAHVWDLSDITQSGTLSRDEFAVAMHLINGALAGQALPQELPTALIPPQLRGQDLPQAVNPHESDTQKDLFSLMDDDDPASLPINTQSAFVTPAAASAPVSAAPKSSGPFDDDFFGTAPTTAALPAATPAALSPVPTGTSSMRAVPPPPPPAGLPTDASADFGNKKLALDSTTKSVADLQTKRSALEGSVASSASSVAELESRLASLRVTHEAESSAVRALEERARAQAAELAQLRKDVITSESELSALRAEKDEVEQTVMRDREDVRDMKRRMAEVQSETLGLKNTLEKLRKEMRQQRGLVAISKKQLATAEGEQSKVREETERVAAGEEDEHLPLPGGPGATSDGTLPVPPAPAQAASPGTTEAALSPAASVRSNNPFDRFTSPPPPPAAAASPASNNNAALAAGGLAGALGLGAATAVHARSADEPSASAEAFDAPAPAAAAQEAATTVVGAPEGADPFALPDAPAPAPVSHAKEPSAASFDDDFGGDFDAPPAAAAASSAGAGAGENGGASGAHPARAASAFDDAFADLDEPKATAPAAAAPAAEAEEASVPAQAEEVAQESTPRAVEASLPDTSASADAPLSAPKGADSFDDFEDSFAPIGESASDPLPASTTAAAAAGVAAPIVTPLPAADDGSSSFETALPSAVGSAPERDGAEEEADSSDEDEGPEDLEGSKATKSGELGFPAAAAIASGAGAAGIVPAQTTGVAEGRFPEIDEVDAITTASAASAAPNSAALTVQHTGDTANDAFEDAMTGETPSGSAALAPPSSSPWGDSSAPSAAAPPAGSAFSTRSSEYAHDRFSTAAEGAPSGFAQPFPLGATAAAPGGPADRSISPNKTRRAPPPAPVRAGTAASPFDAPGGAAGTSSSPFGAVPAAAGGAKGPAPASFDDFDSAFEDLGPVSSSGAQASVPTASAAPLPGFDDAFGDADDFAFVPSFSAPQASGMPPSSSASAGAGVREGLPATDAFSAAFPPAASGAPAAAAQQGAGFGFDDFEASFADAALAPASTAGAGAGAGNASGSGTNSGFSFADDFASSSPAAATAAAGGAGLAPPASAPVKAPSPALPDDAPPVKQLAAMGFSREQVIKALEQSNYKVDRALEKLLAAAN